jgi:hypothetical protein
VKKFVSSDYNGVYGSQSKINCPNQQHTVWLQFLKIKKFLKRLRCAAYSPYRTCDARAFLGHAPGFWANLFHLWSPPCPKGENLKHICEMVLVQDFVTFWDKKNLDKKKYFFSLIFRVVNCMSYGVQQTPPPRTATFQHLKKGHHWSEFLFIFTQKKKLGRKCYWENG